MDSLLDDPSKAKKALGWEPKVKFDQLARLMVDAGVTILEDEMSGRLVPLDRDR